MQATIEDTTGTQDTASMQDTTSTQQHTEQGKTARLYRQVHVERCLMPHASEADGVCHRRGCAYLEQVIHHLGTEAGSDRSRVLQAGAAIHLYQPHIESLVHHEVIPKQLMAVGPGL